MLFGRGAESRVMDRAPLVDVIGSFRGRSESDVLFQLRYPKRRRQRVLRKLRRRVAEDTVPERRGAAPRHRGRRALCGVGGRTGRLRTQHAQLYLVQAVLLTLVCFVLSPFTLFFPFLGVITGIVAIVYGAQVNGKVAGNNYAGARKSSHMARV